MDSLKFEDYNSWKETYLDRLILTSKRIKKEFADNFYTWILTILKV